MAELEPAGGSRTPWQLPLLNSLPVIDETKPPFLFERELGHELLSFVEKLSLDQSVGLPRKSNPHALRNHLLAPQVESHSGGRSEFRKCGRTS